MFSKNIIVLLCVVYFSTAPISDPQLVKKEKIMDEINALIQSHDWQELFNQYDDKEGSISATNLQKLLFEEFHGFLTVRQAERYIKLINLNGSDQMGLEQLKKMAPIIVFLSKREHLKRTDIGNLTSSDITREMFLNEMWMNYRLLFSNETEMLEVLQLIDKTQAVIVFNVEKFEKTIKMLAASVDLEKVHVRFCIYDTDKSGIIDFTKMLQGLKMIRLKKIRKIVAINTIKDFDLNGDKVIDFLEFLIWVMSYAKETEDHNDSWISRKIKIKTKHLYKKLFLKKN